MATVLVSWLLLVAIWGSASASPAWLRAPARVRRSEEEPFVINLEEPQSDQILCRLNNICSIQCTFAGNPVQAISLVKEPETSADTATTSNAILREDKVVGSLHSSVFKIEHVTSRDAGRYVCFATNANKIAVSIRYITVFAPINITDVSAHPTERGQVTYTCSASGLPLPTVRFYRDENLREPYTEDPPQEVGEDGTQVTVTLTTSAGSAPVVCGALNLFGMAKRKL